MTQQIRMFEKSVLLKPIEKNLPPRQSIPFFDILYSLGSPKMKLMKCADYFAALLISPFLRTRNNSDKLPDKPQSILVIRPGGIGDAIYLLPILRNIRQINPSISITVLCEQRNHDIFKSQFGVANHVFSYDKKGEFALARQRSYDVVIDTEQWHFLSALWTSHLFKSKFTIGFATRHSRGKLFHRAVSYGFETDELSNFKTLFNGFIDTNTIQSLEHSFVVSDVDKQWANSVNKTSAVALFIGGSVEARRLTADQNVSIVKDLLHKNLTVLLIGGSDVSELSEEIVKKVADTRLKNFVGQISLSQTAALIAQCTQFIGPDSGIMHLACAVGTPVVAIFGPGNMNKWRPLGEKHKTVNLKLPCSPCTRFGYTIPTCGGEWGCVRRIKNF